MCATSLSIFVFFQGTAFVKFASAESAEKCMTASETDGIFLDGRQVRKLAYCLNLTKLILINSAQYTKMKQGHCGDSNSNSFFPITTLYVSIFNLASYVLHSYFIISVVKTVEKF